jgi:hypothetical protein
MPTSTEPDASANSTASVAREPLAPVTLTRAIPPPTSMTTVEYLILLVLIAAVSVGIWKTFGEPAADSSRRGEPASNQAGAGAADNMLRSIA